MKQLEKEITHKGFKFIQEWRDENYAIYSQWLDGTLIAYEVIKIRKNKAGERFGVKFDDSESYPTDKSWGNEGWTCKTLLEAENKLISIAPNLKELLHGKTVETLSLKESI